MSHSSLDLESSEDSIVPDEAVFLVKNLRAEELRLQISPSLGDLGELQECCCRECNVPLHLAQFVCSGHTHGVDRDTERLTNVLACVREGLNQEHLVWLLWVGADDYSPHWPSNYTVRCAVCPHLFIGLGRANHHQRH